LRPDSRASLKISAIKALRELTRVGDPWDSISFSDALILELVIIISFKMFTGRIIHLLTLTILALITVSSDHELDPPPLI
jgi:hypothetical protein